MSADSQVRPSRDECARRDAWERRARAQANDVTGDANRILGQLDTLRGTLETISRDLPGAPRRALLIGVRARVGVDNDQACFVWNRGCSLVTVHSPRCLPGVQSERRCRPARRPDPEARSVNLGAAGDTRPCTRPAAPLALARVTRCFTPRHVLAKAFEAVCW